jgi:hypothetical protein
MSRIDYHLAVDLKNADVPFYALVMAAMMRADSDNIEILKTGWPEVWREVQARWKAPGGALTGEVARSPASISRARGEARPLPCVAVPVIPEDVPARGKAAEPMKFFNVGGALLCDEPIEGITQDLERCKGEEAFTKKDLQRVRDNLRQFYGGHRYFVGETIMQSAAARLAELLGGYLAPD